MVLVVDVFAAVVNNYIIVLVIVILYFVSVHSPYLNTSVIGALVFAGDADERCFGDSSAVGFVQTRVAVVFPLTNPASRDA